MPPRVSILLPVYNGGPYLGPAIESVLAQTETAWELIVVDDGSTDDTPAVLARYTAHPAITVLRQPNAGLASSRNRAAHLATGPWVAFLDADDVWQPDYLAAMLAALAGDPAAVAAFAGWQYVDAAGTLLPQTVVLPAAAAAGLAETLTYQNALVPSGAMVRRTALEAVGGFDPALTAGEDWDLWLRLAPQGRFIVLPRVLVHYRTHSENMTHKLEEMETNYLRLHQKHTGPLAAERSQWTAAQRRTVAHIWFNTALGYFRQRQPEMGQRKVTEALAVWPSLAARDDFLYELACAYQPRGQRGLRGGPAWAEGAALLHAVVGHDRALWGRACLVLARLAGDPAQARRYAAQALLRAPWAAKPGALRTWLRALSGGRRA